jgi:dihydrofolate reductase
MTLSLIVAVAENGVIGKDGDMPWRLSSDLRRFRQLTMGHCVLMGRKTYEAIGRPLPGRKMIVLTRTPGYQAGESLIAANWDQALELAAEDEQPFVIGGAELFAAALPHTQRMYLTVVHARPEGDTFFPPWDASEWRVVEEHHNQADEKNSAATTFRILERKPTSCR